MLNYSNDKDDISKKERKILIAFDDMIPDMLNNKKINPIAIELFINTILFCYTKK